MTEQTTAGRTHRNGWTLVEMLCVISVLSIVMGIVTTFLSTAFRFNADTNAQFQRHAAVDRLATQFRTDVRNCTAINIEGGQLTLIQPDNGSILYERSAAGIIRRQRDTNQSMVRDGFWFGATWQLAWDEDGTLATMSLTRRAVGANDSNPIRIKAAIGRDVNR